MQVLISRFRLYLSKFKKKVRPPELSWSFYVAPNPPPSEKKTPKATCMYFIHPFIPSPLPTLFKYFWIRVCLNPILFNLLKGRTVKLTTENRCCASSWKTNVRVLQKEYENVFNIFYNFAPNDTLLLRIPFIVTALLLHLQ